MSTGFLFTPAPSSLENVHNRRPSPHSKRNIKRKVKSSMRQQIYKSRLYECSDNTEDGAETESDLFCSSSFSETGEDADVEDFSSGVRRNSSVITRKKVSSSSKPPEFNSEEEDFFLSIHSPVYGDPVADLPPHSQECTLDENCIILSDFRRSHTYIGEGFDDEGTLADIEDCVESEKSELDIGWGTQGMRYLFGMLEM